MFSGFEIISFQSPFLWLYEIKKTKNTWSSFLWLDGSRHYYQVDNEFTSSFEQVVSQRNFSTQLLITSHEFIYNYIFFEGARKDTLLTFQVLTCLL